MKRITTTICFSALLAACAPSYEKGEDKSVIPNTGSPVSDVLPAEKNAELEAYWLENVSSNITQFNCIVCHSDTSIAGHTGWVMLANNQDNYLETNLSRTLSYINAVEGSGQTLINKAQGLNHGGGEVLKAGSDNAEKLSGFVELATSTSVGTPDIPNTGNEPSDAVSETRQAAMSFYISKLENALIQPDCYVCHQSNGVAKNSDLIFIGSNVNDYESFNANTVINFTQGSESNFNNFLLKPIGQSHTGKKIFEVTSDHAKNISEFLSLVEDIVDAPEVSVITPSNAQASVLLGEVFFVWDMSGEHDGFEIQRKQSNGDWLTVSTQAKDASLYRDNSVANDQDYQYRIRAKLGSDFSNYSTALNVSIN